MSVTAPQLMATLQPGLYYAVVTSRMGAAAGGVYTIRFTAQTTDAAAFTMENDTLQQAISNPLGPVDSRWLVKRTDMSKLTPTLGAVRQVDLGVGTDPNDVNAQQIDPLTGYQVQVTNASTGDLNADFPAGSCNTAANGADALFQFTPTQSGNVRLAYTPDGYNGQIVLYDGTSGSPLTSSMSGSTPIDLAPYANETPASAQNTIVGLSQAYLGNLTTMAADVPAVAFDQAYNQNPSGPSLCNADAFGADAFFKVDITGAPKTVEISSAGTSVAHTFAIWGSSPFVKPAAITAQYDTKTLALGTKLNGARIDDGWVVARGTTAMLNPNLPVTTLTEGTSYPQDDTIHAIGNVKGKQFETAGASTSTLAADYLASTLQCPGGADAARDAVFSFSHSTGGKVRLSLNNPNPAFIPTFALFKGMPATAAGVNPPETPTGNGNEARATAYNAMTPGMPRIFSGSTASMANDYPGNTFTRGSAYGSAVCSPDAGGRDAYVAFTVPGTKGVDPPRTVELSSVAASFDHTIAIWDATPVTAPSAVAMNNDTRAAAYTAPIGAIDDDWVVKSSSMTSLRPGGLAAAAPTVANNNDIQVLGDPVGKRVNIAANSSTAGVIGDYRAATMTCGSADAANDIIYRLTPSANTTVRIATNNPSNPGFSTALALFSGANGPKRISDEGSAATTTYCSSGFSFTPSNVNMAGISFTSAPTVTLSCGGTVTFNSTNNTWTSYCAGQTQPTPVVQTQSGGPDIVVLPFKAFQLSSGTTLSLVGTRPVVFMVEGNATVAGIMNASANGTTAGAGGNWSCGSSAGGDGAGSGSLNGPGGAGGGFLTKGGNGGSSGSGTVGAGGAIRGTAALKPLIGGCPGGQGHNGPTGLGGGGGAIQISAGGALSVTGTIRANGGVGPNGSSNDSGGNGGGSGGALLLEGATVTTSGTIELNGGKGGSGQSGGTGGNGSTSTASAGSVGGSGGSDGGGGGGGGYGRRVTNIVACVPTNENFSTAQVVPVGVTQTYTGPSVGMASDLAGTAFKPTGGTCTPDTTGPDAFFKFTLTATREIQMRAQGSNYNHTLTLFSGGTPVADTCADGTVATGATITKTLAAGTYYVGIKSRNTGAGGTFNVSITDTGAGGPFSTLQQCVTTNSLDAALTAGTNYYVVVKGAAAGQAGAYNLTVTDIGAVPDFGCSTDRSAPDAYFDFEVTSTSGRTVTIALNEDATHLDGAFQLVRDGAPLNNSSGDTTYTCETSSRTYTNLPQGRYYVVVRGMTVVGGAGNKPLEISFRDDSGAGSLDCADGSASSAGTLTRTLEPGTYYAGITSRSGAAGGTYKLRLRDTSYALGGGGGTWLACGDSNYVLDYTIPPADANTLHYVVIKGAAAGAEGTYRLTVSDVSSVTDTCIATDPIQMDPTAPDAYFGFTVADGDADGRDITVSLAPTSALDGAYRLFQQSGAPVGDCHDRSAPYTYPNLPAGNYYLALRGKSAASGAAAAPYELSVQDKDAYGSLECRDGGAISGASLTRTLPIGTYYVGVKPQAGQADPLNYRLTFRDTAQSQPSSATELGCSTTGLINTPVVANRPYYVLVKGISPTDVGPYGLTVTDLRSSGDFACGDDPGGGDAYFEFRVNDPNGRRVTIDTERSQLDTVIALFPAGSPIDASGHGGRCNDDAVGGTPGSSRLTADLPQGVYYVVVRAKLGTANPNAPFELSVRDDSELSSIACGATDVTGPATIRKALPAGTYHLVLKGMPGSDKGAYKLQFRDETPYDNSASEVSCNDSQNELVQSVTAGKPYYLIVKGTSPTQSGPYRLTVENLTANVGMGCGANPAAPDAVYRFNLSQDTRVQIDTIGSQTTGSTPIPTDTVIGIYDVSASYFGTNYAEDSARAQVNCDDNSGDAAKGWSKIVASLAGGRDYYVVVKSKSTGWGTGTKLPYTVNIRDLDSSQPIACADVSSSLLMTRNLGAGDYRVVVSNSTGASGGAPFDVRLRNLSAASGGGAQVACADTPDEFTYNMTAGRPYYLVVKGDAATDRGQYGMTVETTGSGATSMGCGANPAAPDAFFKFNVTKQGPVTIDTDGSTPDTVMALYPATTAVFGSNYALDAFGNQIPCDDNSGSTVGASRINATMAPGAYYLVVKGKTVAWTQTGQPFNVSIRDAESTGTIACASASQGGKKIVQNLTAGDYNLVLSTESAVGGAYSVKFRDTARAGTENGSRIACNPGNLLTVNNLAGGRDYYVVVKGNNATDAGGYKLTVEDTVSLSAASGSTSIACAPDGSTIEGLYPAGTYYALVTGNGTSAGGPYTLRARDLDALADQNRLACDDNSGPNQTSVIERDLRAGTHYVVVKSKGAEQKGAYNLHVRDTDAVPDRQLACGGATGSERLEYDVKAGQDYTVLLKGDASTGNGTYNVKLYDQLGLQNNNGQRLTCVSDAQPTTLYNSNWHTKKVDFNLDLTPDTYYVAVKGVRPQDKGGFQLQIGETSARTSTTYTPPSWTEIRDALATSEVRVLPVVATGGDTSNFVAPAEAQAEEIALTTHAVRQDGKPIWQKIQADGSGTGSGLITGIAEIADYLSLDVSLVAVDGPDPGASRFRVNIVPVNSASCVHPHPLVDTSTGACTPRPGDPRGYSCNTQYSCAPGSAPKFKVTFTNPSDAPVPPNSNDAYGGYHFKLQIIGNKKYLLDEVPVYIIPTNNTMGPPGMGGDGLFQPTGVYMQDVEASSCPRLMGGSGGVITNDLPNWSDLYFDADVPEGASIDFQLCAADSKTALDDCVWSDGTTNTRKRITVRSKGSCADNSQCRNVAGFGNGYCAAGTCQFIAAPKVAYDISCANDSVCPNGPLGAGDYYISSRCERDTGAPGYGYCVYSSQPADLGSSLISGEQGRTHARVRITLRADSSGDVAPTLYQWYLTYFCQSAQ
ncbi:MAG: hypothetical protein ABW321_15245 [Polyangiales bacterium]